MSTVTSETPRVGARTELGRYTIRSGGRILYGQRVNGIVRVSDRPGGGTGRSFLVERGLEEDGNAALQALIADYLSQAIADQEVPMLRYVL